MLYSAILVDILDGSLVEHFYPCFKSDFIHGGISESTIPFDIWLLFN